MIAFSVRRSRLPIATLAMAVAVATAGCGTQSGGADPGSPGASAATTTAASTTRALSVSTPSGAATISGRGSGNGAPARIGQTGKSQRVTFAPTAIRLHSSGDTASVQPATTDSTGRLDVPGTGRVGWWRGGAQAGDAYGTVVLAGHVDTQQGGLELFSQLLRARPGDQVTLSAPAGRQTYRITQVRDLPKVDLSRQTEAFAQNVPGRLLLITCTGTFDRARGHYDQNRLVSAVPVGNPTPG